MIDLHSHILPGIDDGPATMEVSLEMARLYEETGFKKVVATPHFIPGSPWMPEVHIIREKTAEFNAALKNHGIRIEISTGMEVGLDLHLFDYLSRNEILTLGTGEYILVEAPFQRLPLGWDRIFFRLMSSGYKILLAHPERSDQLVRDLALVDEIIHSGACIQVNYDSLLGNHGREIQNTAFYLAEKGYIHCLATDSHEPVHRNPRNATHAIDMLKYYFGEHNLVLLTSLNPRRVLDGLALETLRVSDIRPRKKRWVWLKK